MDTENDTPETTVTPDPKKALFQKGVIVGSAVLGLIISMGVTLPKFNVKKEGDFEIAGDVDDESTDES